MSPIPILRSIARLQSGLMIDIGARDCAMSKRFAELGYQIDAIDPAPPPIHALGKNITYHQKTLEQFVAERRYDLVIASMVSHLVKYDIPTLLDRLKSLAAEDGLIYVTLLGEDDGWAANPDAKAISFDAACNVCKSLELKPLYKSTEWLEGRLYSGEGKFWHLFRFVLTSEQNRRPPKVSSKAERRRQFGEDCSPPRMPPDSSSSSASTPISPAPKPSRRSSRP